MGIPKFFRWLGERYPKINQRQTFLPEEETFSKYFPNQEFPPPPPLSKPDPLSTCGLPPEVDILYIDTNGVLHGCSHNNGSVDPDMVREDIFHNVAYYLDRVISDIAKPQKAVYIAIDGVAPRAKLNQQRARRYRGGSDELEQSIYDAFYYDDTEKKKKEGERKSSDSAAPNQVGDRLSGKFESSDESSAADNDAGDPEEETVFHSNEITPGTEFFDACTQYLEHWIQYKLSTDPKWQHLEIIFSGPNVPGEGEHKIMDYMRSERLRPDYDPNLRHAIMGQDADLILLGLATHEPNLVILRERVVFDTKLRNTLSDMGLEDVYLHNCHYEFLHMSVLRDYLMYEFETAPASGDGMIDRERTLDDFVFLTFFVGNDFLPHMPALDIGDEAFELIFHTYKKERKRWIKETANRSNATDGPYLTHAGNIVSGSRLERFLQQLGSHENEYYDTKQKSQSLDKIREMDEKMGFETTIPPEDVRTNKEEADRTAYRQMMMESAASMDSETISSSSSQKNTNGFTPVLTKDVPEATTTTPSSRFQPEEEELEAGFLSRMGSLLQSSIGDAKNDNDDAASSSLSSFGSSVVDDQDLKGRYYYDKFQFSPFDADQHLKLRKAYVEGLVWNLKYYYEGCVSWSWYYPYHYGPMLSDIVGVQGLLNDIHFEARDPGVPLKPFEQLMGCMPPSSAKLLPQPYRWLMTDHEASPIAEFYPKSFIVDMNGKRWPWEAVVLLPFLDAQRLVRAATEFVKDHQLSANELARNTVSEALVYYHDDSVDTTTKAVVPALSSDAGQRGDYFGAFESNASSRVLQTTLPNNKKPVFEPKLLEGVQTPSPGFPSLTTAPIQSLWRRRMGTNVFGSRSRYRTALLETSNQLPELPPLDVLASTLIGTTVYINYPYLMEGYVTALSNSERTIRGSNSNNQNQKRNQKVHSQDETEVWKHTMAAISKKMEYGEGHTGTGGWRLPESNILIDVRPFKGIVTLPDGQEAKTFAKFEVTLPLMAALWSPQENDPRTINLMAKLEKDPFFLEKKGGAANGKKKKGRNGKLLPRASSNSNTRVVINPSDASISSSTAAAASTTTTMGESTSILPPLQGKRGFTTWRPSTTTTTTSRLPSGWRSTTTTTGQRRSITTARRASAGGNLKSRALGFGVMAAVVFLGGGGANAKNLHINSNHHHAFGLGVKNTPAAGLLKNEEDDQQLQDHAPPPLQFEHGTTTLSFIFQGGIVAAVDSRASLGNFVGSKTVQKVLPIDTHMLGTMAGGAADCSYWIRKIKAEAELFQLSSSRRMSVTRASRLLSNALYANRGAGLSVGTMIMGFDEDTGPRIYYVDNTGVCMEGDMFSVGSGSTFALGILDQERRFDMSREEAIALGIKAIRHATFRDAYSGGFINVYLITEKGWEKVFGEDIAGRAANLVDEEVAEQHE